MCRSPNELSTVELERLIEVVKGYLDGPFLSRDARRIYEGRVKGYEEILKERANEGVI